MTLEHLVIEEEETPEEVGLDHVMADNSVDKE
jgi:hypothetical protein